MKNVLLLIIFISFVYVNNSFAGGTSGSGTGTSLTGSASSSSSQFISYGYNCNPQNLQYLRKSIDNVKSGTAQATWFMLGDSTMYGEYSNNGTDSGNLVPGSLPSQLADILISRGINANSNSFMGGSGSAVPNRSATDSRLSFGAGWAVNSGTSIGGGFLEQSAQNTAALSFTPTTMADTFKFLYITDPTGGTLSVDINGSGTTSYNSSVSSGFAIQSIVGTLGNNTLNVKYVSGASKNIYFQGIIAYNSAKPSVNIINAGWGGSLTSNWLLSAAAYNPFPLIPVLGQDVTFINLGNNDCNNSVAVSTFKSNMQSIITQALTANSGNTNVVLLPMNPTSNVCSQATQQTYVTALYQLASTNNLCLIDNYALFGSSYTTANNLGLMGNTVHPNQLGYADQAYEIFNVIGGL